MARNSLFPAVGNAAAKPPPRQANQARWPAGGARIRAISLYFPVDQGIGAQRRVRAGLPAPPTSLLWQRLPARTRVQPEKSPRFRGVLAVKPSLIRTGDCGFRAWKTAQPVFFSVAKLGGSVSLPIRLSEGRGSADPRLRMMQALSRVSPLGRSSERVYSWGPVK